MPIQRHHLILRNQAGSIHAHVPLQPQEILDIEWVQGMILPGDEISVYELELASRGLGQVLLRLAEQRYGQLGMLADLFEEFFLLGIQVGRGEVRSLIVPCKWEIGQEDPPPITLI